MDATRLIDSLFNAAERFGQLAECQHAARLSVDEYGQPQYGTPTPFQAMWLPERQRVANTQGEEVMSRGKLWVPSRYPMIEGDQVILPDGTTPPIVAVSSAYDNGVAAYFEVFI